MKHLRFLLFLLLPLSVFSQGNVRISDMPAASNLTGAYIPIIQGGINKKAASSLFSGGSSFSLTTTGNSGSATFIGGVLNIPTYTLTGLGGTSLNSFSALAPLVYNNSTGQFNIPEANSITDGYLSASDWNIFNNKISTISGITAGGDLSGTYANPIVSKILGNTIPINASGVLTNNGSGILSWSIPVTQFQSLTDGPGSFTSHGLNYFRVNSGATALEYRTSSQLLSDISGVSTSRNINTTSPLLGGGTLSSDLTLSIPVATSSVNGYLSSSDWTTFNNKQNAFGSQTANFFYASPNGSTGIPSFRAIVAGDIPTLNQNTTGSSGSVLNSLTIGAELISGGASSFNGSTAKTIGIQAASVTNSMLAGSIDLTSKVTGVLPVVNGGTGVSSVTISPTSSAFAGWDSNKNFSSNNFSSGYTTTATSGATTTLTVSSTRYQYFTGSTTQTIVLPVVSTLWLGPVFEVVNKSTGNITIETSGINVVQVMAPGTTLSLRCVSLSGTGTSSWDWDYNTTNPLTSQGSLIIGGVPSGGVAPPTELLIGGANTVLHGGSTTPSYSAVSLTADVTGILPVGSGGTGITSLGTGVATWLGTPSWTNFNAAITGSTPYWALTGTSTLSGIVTITSNTASQHIFNGTWTASASNQNHIDLTGSITARATASDAIRYLVIDPTLTSTAATQTLTAMLVNPTFVDANSATKYIVRFQSGGTDRWVMNSTGQLSNSATAPVGALNITGTLNATTFSYGGGASNTYSLTAQAAGGGTMFLFSASNNSGNNSLTYFSLSNSQFNPASGSNGFTGIQTSGLTYNTTGTYSGTIRFIDYNPIETSLTGASHYFITNRSTTALSSVGGVTSPTAFWHIGASTTAAASLRISESANTPSSPNAGDIWNESTNHRLMFRQNITSVEFLGTSSVNSVSPTSPNRTITVVIGGTTYYIAAKTTND